MPKQHASWGRRWFEEKSDWSMEVKIDPMIYFLAFIELTTTYAIFKI